MKANTYVMNLPDCYYDMDSDEIMYQGGASGIHAYTAQRVMEGQEEQKVGTSEIVGWSLEGLTGVISTIAGAVMGSTLFAVVGLIGLATTGLSIGTSINNMEKSNEKNCIHTYNSHGIGL